MRDGRARGQHASSSSRKVKAFFEDEDSGGKRSQEEKRTINPLTQLPHPPHLSLNARLRKDVVVLDPVQQLRQTPEGICFERLEDRGREGGDVVKLGVGVCVAERARKGGNEEEP